MPLQGQIIPSACGRQVFDWKTFLTFLRFDICPQTTRILSWYFSIQFIYKMKKKITTFRASEIIILLFTYNHDCLIIETMVLFTGDIFLCTINLTCLVNLFKVCFFLSMDYLHSNFSDSIYYLNFLFCNGTTVYCYNNVPPQSCSWSMNLSAAKNL